MHGSTMVWESGTSDDELGGDGGRMLCFPFYLFIENEGGTILFESTLDSNGRILRLDANCNLSITDGDGGVVWETGTSCEGTP